MSKYFNFFDRFQRCVDWFDRLKLSGFFDRFGPRVDSIDRSHIGRIDDENRRRGGRDGRPVGAFIPKAMGQL
jgi:hypothetical protein